MNKILFIGCNDDQIPYLRELKNRELYVIGTDINSKAPGLKLCDRFYNIAYDQFAELIEIGNKEQFTKSDYIFTASAQFAHLGAAIFAGKFGIKYPPQKTIQICLDKSKFYRYFKQNNIPIPATCFIEDEKKLISEINNFGKNKNYFLKSDQSKNPNYIYNFNGNNVPLNNINWEKDRYFQKYYILQEEFLGTHVRLNIFGDEYNYYPFDISKGFDLTINQELLDSIIIHLKQIITSLSLSSWLIKFDIIVHNEKWVALDIGLDPPYRMLNYYINNNLDFYTSYIDQYLFKNYTYFEMDR